MMKKLAVFVLAVWSLALCDRLAIAQTQVIPNGVGGYNSYGPNGTTQIQSNGVGGYNVYGPSGSTQVIPNGVGGYNVYGR
jgi:hypothetical protein